MTRIATVVHAITKLEMGGAQENTLYTCGHLDRARFRVVLIHGPGGFLDEQARSLPDTRIEVLPELVREVNPRLDASCSLRLLRLFAELRGEHLAAGGDPRAFIVHTHSSKAGILGRIAARAAGVPLIVHGIHGFGFHPGQNVVTQSAYLTAELVASRITDAFISVSRANLAEGQARGIIRREHQVALIRSGFSLAEYREAGARRDEVRASLGLGSDDEVIVCIANLKPQKDPLTLVEAMFVLSQSRPRAVLLYAGDGELRPAVEAAVRARGLEDRFRLLGWREDVAELLAASDVVALSSRFEGLPRSAVQALASRKPFVGTRVDGTPEIIRDGRNGFLVEPGSPEELARALDRALAIRPVDPADQERILEWDADRMVRAQEELYARLIAAKEAD